LKLKKSIIDAKEILEIEKDKDMLELAKNEISENEKKNRSYKRGDKVFIDTER